ncbi:MAG: Lacal_2735 family protein [Dokdonia sp.]
MNSAKKHKRIKNFMERKYQRLVEEAYNLKYTDASTSDILTYEALKIDQKLKFLEL